MNFKRHTGSAKIITLPRKKTVDITAGEALVIASGKLQPADASATKETIKGIAGQTLASGTGDMISIDIPNDTADIFRAKVGNGTFGVTKIGNRYDLDGDGKVDLTNSTNEVVEVVGDYPETDEILVRFVLA